MPRRVSSKWRLSFVLGLVTLSCEAAERIIHLPTDDAQAVVLVMRSPESGAALAQAVSASETPARIEPSLDGDLDLYALEFDCPLSHLLLPSGRLPISPNGRRRLPRANRVYAGYDVLGVFGGWMEETSPEPPEPVATLSLALEALNPCSQFGVEIFVVPGTERAAGFGSFAVVTPAGQLLLGVEYHAESGRTHLFTLDDDGLRELPSLIGVAPDVQIIQAFALGDDQFFLLTNQGAYRGSLSAGFVPAPKPRSSFVLPRPALGGGPTEGTDFELYLTDPVGLIEWLPSVETSTSWRVLGRLEGPDDGKYGVAWESPGHVTVWRRAAPALMRIEDSSLESEIPPGFDPELEDYSQTLVVPGLGLVLATDQRTGTAGRSRLMVRARSGDWSELETPPTPGEIEAMAFLSPGLLYGGYGGVFAEYVHGYGYCPAVDSFGGTDVAFILPRMNDVIVASAGSREGGVRVIRTAIEVRGTSRADSCPRE